jgi:putative endonuclease
MTPRRAEDSDILSVVEACPRGASDIGLKTVLGLRSTSTRSAQDGKNFMPYFVYILECADGSYYTGSTEDINNRIWQHEQGVQPSSYTYSRRPVKLVWTSEETMHYYDALQWERQIKGRSRVKKQALIRGDLGAIHEIVKSERNQREHDKKRSPR